MTATPLNSSVRGTVERVVDRRRQLQQLRLIWLSVTLVGVSLGVLGALRAAGLLALTLGSAVLLSLPIAGMAITAITYRRPPPDPRESARLIDRRAKLDHLLITAYELTGHPQDGQEPLEQALRHRVMSQAQEVTAVLDPVHLVPAPAAWSWAWPALAVTSSLALWLFLMPVARPTAQATVNGLPSSTAVPSPGPTVKAAAPSEPSSDAPIVNEPTPEPSSPPPVPAQTTTGTLPTSTAAEGGPVSRINSNQASGTPRHPRPRLTESRLSNDGPRSAPSITNGAPRNPGSTSNTPFGARESGSFSNQSVAEQNNKLAAAPYDPNAAPGSKPQQQKAPPGSSGLRSASGGRGIESDSNDKCVQGCLTNNDMNRGGARTPGKPKPPGGETASGTSDSGAGAAGSSSQTGLGTGHLHEVQSRTQTTLGDNVQTDGDQNRVLAEAGSAAHLSASGAAVSGVQWRRTPEAPTDPEQIPLQARSTVEAYFDRSQP